MSITFAVDDVTPAESPPPTTPLGEVVGDVLALGLDRALPVIELPRTHPLLGTVHVAFSEHRPLVLSPDAIWLTIAQGLARHVRLEPESVRGKLVRHEGTQRLVVTHDGPFPTDADALASLVTRMREKVAEEIGAGPTRLFVCDFSTTTDVERLASEIVLLDACSPFFDYGVECVCGIPSITLTGTVEDWQSVRRRVDAMGDLLAGSRLGDWPARLGVIVDKLLEAARGHADRAFFRRIYKPKAAYGTDRVTGWIAWLYPYIGVAGCYDVLNPLLAHAPERPLPGEERVRAADAVGPDWWSGPGIRAQDVPADLGECLFAVTDHVRGVRFDVTLRGGLACATVDARGALVPRAAWWCERGAPSIDELAARLGGAAPATPPRASGLAELDALLRQTGSVAIHGELVRSLPQVIPFSIGQNVFGGAHFRLGDGGLLAVVDGMATQHGRPVWIRVPESALAEGQAGMPRACCLSPVELPIACERLTAFLAEALDSGRLPPPREPLFVRLAESLRVPRLPHTASQPVVPRKGVLLGPRTTLELGGAARLLVEARTDSEVGGAIALAEKDGLPLFVLGGGSNLIVPDDGYDGLVLSMAMRGVATMPAVNERSERTMRVTAAAGEPWDDFVAYTVANGWQGLECLSGIPGLVGATPVQNVGAYGQDVSETIVAVGVVDRATKLSRTLTPAECQFAYRDSALKRDPARYVVTWVCFELRPGAPPALKYAELQKALADRQSPTLTEVRDTVIALRKKKSMVLDAFDPNRRSAGSFFTNPIVAPEAADEVVRRAIERGLAKSPTEVPRWPEKDGRVKLAAGWLIEKSGIEKGLRRGNVGISSAHALALVHHGGGTTKELLALADHVRASVREAFGVELEREPVLMR
jgi:UDP-N-acetylmuramate dehydrogenase